MANPCVKLLRCLTDLAIVILEYVRTIREEKTAATLVPGGNFVFLFGSGHIDLATDSELKIEKAISTCQHTQSFASQFFSLSCQTIYKISTKCFLKVGD